MSVEREVTLIAKTVSLRAIRGSAGKQVSFSGGQTVRELGGSWYFDTYNQEN